MGQKQSSPSSKVSITVDQCMKLIPIIPFGQIVGNMSVAPKTVIQALAKLDPSPWTISWIASLMQCSEKCWYDWYDSSFQGDYVHFIAAHPRYYEQYVLTGGDIKSFCNLKTDNNSRLRDINSYRETASGNDMKFWWPDMSEDISVGGTTDVQLRCEYAVILEYVNCNNKPNKVDQEDIYNIARKYNVYSALNVDSIVKNVDAIVQKIESMNETVDSSVRVLVQQSIKMTILRTLIGREIQNENVKIIPRFTRGTELEREGEIIEIHGVKGTISLYNRDIIKLFLGLPLECGIRDDILMNMLETALYDPLEHQAKIRDQNIRRLENYATSLPYCAMIAPIGITGEKDENGDTKKPCREREILNMLPCYLIPYDDDGSVKYFLCNGEDKLDLGSHMGLLVDYTNNVCKKIRSIPMTFIDAVEVLSDSKYRRIMNRYETNRTAKTLKDMADIAQRVFDRIEKREAEKEGKK